MHNQKPVRTSVSIFQIRKYWKEKANNLFYNTTLPFYLLVCISMLDVCAVQIKYIYGCNTLLCNAKEQKKGKYYLVSKELRGYVSFLTIITQRTLKIKINFVAGPFN